MTALNIWKITLNHERIGSPQMISLPMSCRVLSVGCQDGNLVMWVQFNQAFRDRLEAREFIVAFTGHITQFPLGMRVFLGTAQIGQFVYHVFEMANL